MLLDIFGPSEESLISCLIFAPASPSGDFREISGPEAFAWLALSALALVLSSLNFLLMVGPEADFLASLKGESSA